MEISIEKVNLWIFLRYMTNNYTVEVLRSERIIEPNRFFESVRIITSTVDLRVGC